MAPSVISTRFRSVSDTVVRLDTSDNQSDALLAAPDLIDDAAGIESSLVDDGAVELRVIDNGPGVPDEMKDEIFQESVTSEGTGSVGFGLHFVRVMMDRYDGDAWFEDREDGQRGAVAVLQFKLAEQNWYGPVAGQADQ